jgi:GntR family transcriptional regulator, rspAB operon transcriptional repressor
MTPSKARLAPVRAPKRTDQGEQVRLLREALAGVAIDPALPYTAQVFRAMKAAILSLRLMPRTPLSEAAIAEVLGLSRTPVREALKDLSAENLIDIFPQAGTVVAPIRMRLIEQGVFVRDALESANLLDLMHRLDATGRGRIERLLEVQKRALDTGDYAEFFLQDETLHRLLFELTDRLPIWVIVNQAKQHVDRARLLLTKDNFAICQRAYAEHLDIVRALFGGDESVLREALHHHVVNVTGAVVDYAQRTHSTFVTD